MATSGPNLGVMEFENQGVVWYAEALRLLRALDGLIQAAVLDKDLTTPPGSPSNGDRYIVGASATGAWAGQDGKIARYQNTASPAGWEFFTPKEGWSVWVADEDKLYRYTGAAWTTDLSYNLRDVAVPFIIDGGGSAITTGLKGGFEIPFDGNIVAARVFALDGNTGSIVLDLWKDTYANFPPTVADTITASAKPTISSGTKSEDTTLTGWTTSVSAGDICFVNVDSIDTLTRVLLSLTIRRS